MILRPPKYNRFELCTCGHNIRRHGEWEQDNFGDLDITRLTEEPCIEEDCNCLKFLWKDNLRYLESKI